MYRYLIACVFFNCFSVFCDFLYHSSLLRHINMFESTLSQLAYQARRGAIDDPDVWLDVTIPPAMLPRVRQIRLEDCAQTAAAENSPSTPLPSSTTASWGPVVVHASVPAGRKKRIAGVDFPDFNVLFVPLRHLILQGAVPASADPTASSSMEYTHPQAVADAMYAFVFVICLCFYCIYSIL